MLAVVGTAGVLAGVSGSLQAVQWAIGALGVMPVCLIGAFASGAAVMHAIHQAVGMHSRDSETPTSP